MEALQRFWQQARGGGGRVVLPEGRDDRVLKAARQLKDESLAEPIVLGKAEQVAEAANASGVDVGGLTIVDPANAERLSFYADQYAERRGVPSAVALRLVRKPLAFAGMMVANGDADTLVAGVAHATATVIQAAAVTIGYAPGIETASSFFLMILPDQTDRAGRSLIFADCAVNVQPTAAQLADIAIATHRTAERLLENPPRVAMLSFSTCGSADHPDVAKVQEALAIVRERSPGAPIDGEFQADAALSASVAAKKVKRPSDVAGQANVLIFPDLDAGNIAYKLTQYLAGAQAIGPFLQGFARPISDLSRGASPDDIVATAVLCLAQC